MDKIYKALFSALAEKAGLDCGHTAPEALDKAECEALYKIAKKHDLAHMLAGAEALRGCEMSPELASAISKDKILATYRHARQRSEYERLLELFEEEKIPFMPLKGSVLRAHYPNPADRTSSDIDLFVEERDLDGAVALLVERLGYKAGWKDVYDVSTYSPSGVHVEMHYSLSEKDERVARAFNNIMERTTAAEGCEQHRLMPPEYFYAFHIVHMAKHFTHGGSGIRGVLDLAIINAKMPYDKETADSVLKECGALVFAEEIERLSRVWFGGEEHTALTREMQEYIVGGGAFGSLENQVAINNKTKGGRFRYILGRIFAPYDRLKLYYPRLDKYPILMPYYQIKRWCRLLFTKSRKRALTELKHNQTVSSETSERIVGMCNRLGLLSDE